MTLVEAAAAAAIRELSSVAPVRHSSDEMDGTALVLQWSGPYMSISMSERSSSPPARRAGVPRRLALPPAMAGVASSAEAAAAVTDDSKKLTMG